MSARTLTTILLFTFAPACVFYEEDRVDVALIADEVAQREGGTFTVDEAIVIALRQNPTLRELATRAEAAGAETTVPIDIVGELRGRNEAIGAMIDPIALLGLGPRGGAIDIAEAEHARALQELAVARWRTVGAVIETFLVEEALVAAEPTRIAIDTAAFEAAGLASPVAIAEMKAAQTRSFSESTTRDMARLDNRATLQRLLGLPRAAHVVLTTPPADLLKRPAGTESDLLDRPDLALAARAFEVRDAEFRKACADQYPSIQIGPNISLRGDPIRAMGMLRIPLAMGGRAEAARLRRRAAREALEAAFLEAQREATATEAELVAAGTELAMADATLEAKRIKFEASRAALEVDGDAFHTFAHDARDYAMASNQHRIAAVRWARARIARAIAFGWPLTEQAQ